MGGIYSRIRGRVREFLADKFVHPLGFLVPASAGVVDPWNDKRHGGDSILGQGGEVGNRDSGVCWNGK